MQKNKIKMLITIDNELKEELDKIAIKENRTVNNLIVAISKNFINKSTTKNKDCE